MDERHFREKVYSIEEAVEIFGPTRKFTLVFTNGCFDLLHRGHIEYLYSARSLGDRLLVAINTDSSVKRIKGDNRPLVNQDDRAAIVASLEMVDAVILFDDDTPRKIIRCLAPDVLVKGGDYSVEQVVGAEEVEKYGGRVCIVPIVSGYSTTILKDKIDEIF